jgi:thymidylate kinase
LGRRLPPPGPNEDRTRSFKKPFVSTLWLSIAILDLMLVYGAYVRISRFFGRIVIADRYLSDTWIDFRLNFPEVEIDQWILWKILKRVTPQPDVSFLLIIPVEESLHRSKQKNVPFPDSEEVLQKRLNLYLELSSMHKWFVLDCLQPIKAIHKSIRSRIVF